MRSWRGYGRRYRTYERYDRYRNIHKTSIIPRHRYYRKLPMKTNNLISLIGLIIVLIGIIVVFKNTMIYSGVGYSKGIKIGIPCGLSFILIMIGIAFKMFNKRSFLGWILIGVGILGFFIGILMNIRMVFMPINLLKAIMLFGTVTVGLVILIKGFIENWK